MSSPFISLASNATWFESERNRTWLDHHKSLHISYSPVLLQLVRSSWSWNPVLHEHWNEPSVFVHVWSHTFLAHSSISSWHWSPVHPAGHWQTFGRKHFPPLRHARSQVAVTWKWKNFSISIKECDWNLKVICLLNRQTINHLGYTLCCACTSAPNPDSTCRQCCWVCACEDRRHRFGCWTGKVIREYSAWWRPAVVMSLLVGFPRKRDGCKI